MNKVKVALGALALALTVTGGISQFAPQAAPAAEAASGAAITVGKPAPDFSATDTKGKQQKLSDYKGKFVVLEWNNPDCPFVHKHYDSKNMQSLQDKYTGKGVVWLVINSSAKGKQGCYTAAEHNDIMKKNGSHPTAYIIDEPGTIGKLYGAKATPTMFVIDKAGNVAYFGAIDSKNTAEQSDIKTATNYVTEALDAQLGGKPVKVSSTKAYGCGVHYQ
jgi:peroxiredoxin